MKTEAIITMVLAQGIVTGAMIYFFYRVLNTKPKPEPDSYSENDEEKERQHND